jgi:uncharacterized protein YaiE (UPF0345 family)
MTDLSQVKINPKANVYFDGKCVSHGIELPTARRRASA